MEYKIVQYIFYEDVTCYSIYFFADTIMIKKIENLNLLFVIAVNNYRITFIDKINR